MTVFVLKFTWLVLNMTRFSLNRIRNFGEEKKSFSKIIVTPLPRPQPDLRKCVTSMNFNSYSFFAGPLGHFRQQLKIWVQFIGFQKKEKWGQLKKVASRHQLSLRIFSKIRIWFWVKLFWVWTVYLTNCRNLFIGPAMI